MTDILKELFDSSLYQDRAPSDELKALCRREIDQWDQLKPVIGLEKIDEIANVRGQIDREIEMEWFRRGFHLGASLILELIK